MKAPASHDPFKFLSQRFIIDEVNCINFNQL